MNLCARKGCRHPLAFHDPCSKCHCPGFATEDTLAAERDARKAAKGSDR